jgi:hypothetical protein
VSRIISSVTLFGEGAEDVVGGFALDEGLWLFVVVVEIVSDGSFELPCGSEAVAADLLSVSAVKKRSA